MRLLFSSLGDIRNLNISEYQVPNSNSSCESFISVAPLVKGFSPDEIILVVPNSLLTYFSNEELKKFQNKKYNEIIEDFKPRFKDTKNNKSGKTVLELLKNFTDKEPRFIVSLARGIYTISGGVIKLKISTRRENLYTHLFFKIWDTISDKILEFIKDPNQQQLELIVDITHGFNYITFYLAQVVREIAFIIGRLVSPGSISNTKENSKKISKEISFELFSYTPFQPGTNFELIEIENIKNIEKIPAFGFFEVVPSKKKEIVNAKLSEKLRKIVDEISKKMSLFIGSLVFGLPLHLVFYLYELQKLDPDPKSIIREVIDYQEENIKISMSESTFEIEDNLKFTENFINVVKGLVAFEILSTTNEIHSFDFKTGKKYFDLDQIKEIAKKTFYNERFSERFYALELNKISDYLNKKYDYNKEYPFKLDKGSSDAIRNFFAHSGLSSEAFYFYKKCFTLENKCLKNLKDLKNLKKKFYLSPNLDETSDNLKFTETIIKRLLQI